MTSAALNDKVLTFFNRARRIDLGPLDMTEVDAYYASTFKELGIRIDPDLRRRAASQTGGSPYMLQLIGHNLEVYVPAGGFVDEEMLEDALTAARADYENDICKTTLAALSDRDVDFLAAMSLDEGPSAIGDVASRMNVTQDYAQKYRRRLLDAGVIEAPRRGEVSFAVPYLADYLRDRG